MDSHRNKTNLFINKFTFLEQTKLFASFKERKLSGQISFENPSKCITWHLYWYLGKIVYSTGGIHPVRRWQRNLKINHLPQQKTATKKIDIDDNIWEYEQLFSWLQKRKISLHQAENSISFVVSEVCFDLIQAEELVCYVNQNNILYPKIKPVEPLEIVAFNQQVYQDTKILKYNLDLSPVILNSQKLQTVVNIKNRKIFTLLNHDQTIKDLAVQLNKSALEITLFLLPYIQQKIIGLAKVPDILQKTQLNNNNCINNIKRPLIACVDDSITVSRILEKSINIAGYNSIIINDPTKAVNILLTYQPDLILLDVIMPKINGYQLCSQLRQYPEFFQIPIIFLTGNNGIVDRIKAKRSGANGFIHKNIDIDLLFKNIDLYLKKNHKN